MQIMQTCMRRSGKAERERVPDDVEWTQRTKFSAAYKAESAKHKAVLLSHNHHYDLPIQQDPLSIVRRAVAHGARASAARRAALGAQVDLARGPASIHLPDAVQIRRLHNTALHLHTHPLLRRLAVHWGTRARRLSRRRLLPRLVPRTGALLLEHGEAA
ncbi:hypothetical protein L1887_53999 [Cichorium endivia]|nr:hypothetical protein L1887_53999 [Cichorium endivia]